MGAITAQIWSVTLVVIGCLRGDPAFRRGRNRTPAEQDRGSRFAARRTGVSSKHTTLERSSKQNVKCGADREAGLQVPLLPDTRAGRRACPDVRLRPLRVQQGAGGTYPRLCPGPPGLLWGVVGRPDGVEAQRRVRLPVGGVVDRKSTRLNSSHVK